MPPGGTPAPAAENSAAGASNGVTVAVAQQEPGRGTGPRPAARFARRHWLFGAALAAGAAIRVIAMLGFRGPLWTPDSTRYVRDALSLVPGTVRPAGYSLMLRLLEPLHSLTAVVAVQHVMGLAVGVAGYALLRRAGLPGWGATLAMVPVLLSAYAVQLEHFLMSDTLFALLVMAAIVLMMWWPTPPLWAVALAGLLLAAATLARSEGIPLLAAFLVFLLVKVRGWRLAASAAALVAAFALPVAGYAAWYDSAHGQFELTSSTGAFLYGGVATFADCAVMKPPAAERQLCLHVPVSQRKWADYYIWAGPISGLPGGPFGQRANTLGKDFALAAIRAQPLAYARTVADYFWTDFLPPASLASRDPATHNRALHLREFMFPAGLPRQASAQAARIYSRYGPAGAGLRVVRPYAAWIRGYQRYVVAPGPLLGVMVLAGLGGAAVAWRRFGGSVLLPLLAGLCLLATPALIGESYPRYLVADIPALCLAAGLGVRQLADTAGWLRGRSRPAVA